MMPVIKKCVLKCMSKGDYYDKIKAGKTRAE
jgi:hypothetical protein